MPFGQRLRRHGVERCERDASVVQCGPQCVLIDQRTTRDVHQMQTGLHLLQQRVVHYVLRARRPGCAQHEVIGVFDQCFECANHFNAGNGARRIGASHRFHAHPKGQRALGNGGPNTAEPNQRDRRVLERAQRRVRKVPPLRRFVEKDIGEAFRFRNERVRKTELVIFLRPVVVTNPTLESDELRFFQRFLPQAGAAQSATAAP